MVAGTPTRYTDFLLAKNIIRHPRQTINTEFDVQRESSASVKVLDYASCGSTESLTRLNNLDFAEDILKATDNHSQIRKEAFSILFE